MKKILLLLSMLFVTSISCMETESNNRGLLSLSGSALKRRPKFIFNIDGQLTSIPSYLVDPVLREATPEQIQAFNKAGCRMELIKYDSGEFGVRAMVPGKGGGPLFGAVLAWSVRAASYTAGSAAAAAVVTTNPAVGIPATLAVVAEYAATTEGAAAAAAIVGYACWFLP